MSPSKTFQQPPDMQRRSGLISEAISFPLILPKTGCEPHNKFSFDFTLEEARTCNHLFNKGKSSRRPPPTMNRLIPTQLLKELSDCYMKC